MNETGRDRHERQVDALLHGMGSGTPPEGMEQRIAAAVRMAAAGREEAAHEASSWGGLLRWTVWSPVLAALLVALLVGSYAAWHQPYRRSGGLRMTTSKNPSAQVAAAPAPPGNKAVLSTLRVRKRSPAAGSARRSQGALAPGPAATLQQASFPAPPLPITQQERLLLKLVRRSDPVLIASLTPEAREAERKREKEEVRRFFAPPPPDDEAGQ